MTVVNNIDERWKWLTVPENKTEKVRRQTHNHILITGRELLRGP